MNRLLPIYLVEGKAAVQRQAQYRGAAFISVLGFLIEPIVYLIVWRTVAEQAGDINGRWRLNVSDNLAQDIGKLNSWQLKLTA